MKSFGAYFVFFLFLTLQATAELFFTTRLEIVPKWTSFNLFDFLFVEAKYSRNDFRLNTIPSRSLFWYLKFKVQICIRTS